MEKPPPIYIPRSSPGLEDRDDERLVIIHQSGQCYSGSEESFERVAHLCARTFKVPLAIVSFLDTTKQWLKSKLGFDYSSSSQEEDVTVSFYSSLISEQTSRLLVIKDFMEDARFQKHPKAWASQNLRFYAGANLIVNGVKIGTMCIIDKVPRHDFDESSEILFLEMADLLVEILEEMQNQQIHTYNHSIHLHQTLLSVLQDPLERLNATFGQIDRAASGLRRDPSWGRFSSFGNLIDTFASNVHHFENLVETSLQQLHGSITEKIPQWESDHFLEGVSYDDIDGCPFPASLDLTGSVTTPTHHPPDNVSVASWLELLLATVHSDRELGEDKIAVHPCVDMDMTDIREKYWLQHRSNTSPVSQQLMKDMNQSVSQMLIVAVTIYLRHFISLPQYQHPRSHLRSFLPIDTSMPSTPAITVTIDIDTDESALLIEICPVHFHDKPYPLSLGLETTIQMLLHSLHGVVCDVFEHDNYKVLLTIPLYCYDPSVLEHQISFDDPSLCNLVTVVNDANHTKQLNSLCIDTSNISPIEESSRECDSTKETSRESSEHNAIISSSGPPNNLPQRTSNFKAVKGCNTSTPFRKAETSIFLSRGSVKSHTDGNGIADLHIRAKPLPHSPTVATSSLRSPRSSFSGGLPPKRRLRNIFRSQSDVGNDVPNNKQQRPWWWQLLIHDDTENDFTEKTNSVEEDVWLKSSPSASMSASHSRIAETLPSSVLTSSDKYCTIPQNLSVGDTTESTVGNFSLASSTKKVNKRKKRSRISLSLLFSKNVTVTPPPPTPIAIETNNHNNHHFFSEHPPLASSSSPVSSGHTSSSSGGSSNSSSNSASGSSSCRSIRVPIPVSYPIARASSFIFSPFKVNHNTPPSSISQTLPALHPSEPRSSQSLVNQSSVSDLIVVTSPRPIRLYHTFSCEDMMQPTDIHDTQNTWNTSKISNIAFFSRTTSQSIDVNDDLTSIHPYTDTEELSPLTKPTCLPHHHIQHYQHKNALFSHRFHHSFHRPLYSDKNHHFRKQQHNKRKQQHSNSINRSVMLNQKENNQLSRHPQYHFNCKRNHFRHHQDSQHGDRHAHAIRGIRFTGHTLHFMSPQVTHHKKQDHPCHLRMMMPLLVESMQSRKLIKCNRNHIGFENDVPVDNANVSVSPNAAFAAGV